MLEWLKTHPEAGWLAFTAALSIAFKILVILAPNHPRIAGLVKVLVGAGFDAAKVTKGLRQIASGKYDPLAGRTLPPPPNEGGDA